MRITLSLILAAALSGCSSMESGPYVNDQALRQMADTKARASEYERQGYSPGDAWQTARLDTMGGPFGPLAPPSPTPIAGYGLGTGSSPSR
jgi:hypothetical protein